MLGREIVREQLQLEIDQRFLGRYDPTLVFIEGKWHYPISSTRTLCGMSVPEKVTAVKNSDFSGPSTKACSECRPPVGGMTKRDLRRQIVKFLDDGETNTSGFSKDTLESVLAAVEKQKCSDSNGGGRSV